MFKKIIALMLVLLTLTAFTACGEKKDEPLTAQQAVQIAVTDAGYSLTDVTNAHPHQSLQDGVIIYQIHFSAGGNDFTYEINGNTGEILSRG